MNFYLNKYGFQPPSVQTPPHPNLGISVVIPCFNEPDLVESLKALWGCEKPSIAVEVLIVINSSEEHSNDIKAQNRQTYHQAQEWIAAHQTEELQFHLIVEEHLPRKHAGVGLARKIGMDEAVARFHALNKDGIIVCFDADSKCDTNYLCEIERHFNQNPKTPGCAIYYEHPLQGDDFPVAVYEGIVNYELHLRYYNQALRYAHLPYAFHTVGSSMAVRSSAYQKQGGMNKRKAGEDFYFIHKIIELGDFTELNATRVIPSPRISDRVPFGTGKAIGDWVEQGKQTYETYAFESFEIIRQFAAAVPHLRMHNLNELNLNLKPYQHDLLHSFLASQGFESALTEIRNNAKEEAAFLKRFFKWFDAFKVLKAVHYFRDHGLENKPVISETGHLLKALGYSQVFDNEFYLLIFLRSIEKK